MQIIQGPFTKFCFQSKKILITYLPLFPKFQFILKQTKFENDPLDYPLLPETKRITYDMLSPHTQNLLKKLRHIKNSGENWSTTKLIATLATKVLIDFQV